jgi:hypothetical protein
MLIDGWMDEYGSKGRMIGWMGDVIFTYKFQRERAWMRAEAQNVKIGWVCGQ